MAKEQLTKYQIWYRKNKEALSKRRRERYKKDKKYRNRNLKACREWRKENRPWEQREKVVRKYLLIGEFAAEVGCSPETLRNLERKKMLPRTTDGTSRRHYHPGNVRWAQKLVEFRKEVHYSDPKYKARLKVIVAQIKTHWKKAE